MNIYVLKDRLADCAYEPFFQPNDDMAIRLCMRMVNNPELGLTPEDYTLFCLGSYNAQDMVVVADHRAICTLFRQPDTTDYSNLKGS